MNEWGKKLQWIGPTKLMLRDNIYAINSNYLANLVCWKSKQPQWHVQCKGLNLIKKSTTQLVEMPHI